MAGELRVQFTNLDHSVFCRQWTNNVGKMRIFNRRRNGSLEFEGPQLVGITKFSSFGAESVDDVDFDIGACIENPQHSTWNRQRHENASRSSLGTWNRNPARSKNSANSKGFDDFCTSSSMSTSSEDPSMSASASISRFNEVPRRS